MALGQIVKNRDIVARVEQFLHADRADITRAASDKYIHARQFMPGKDLPQY